MKNCIMLYTKILSRSTIVDFDKDKNKILTTKSAY